MYHIVMFFSGVNLQRYSISTERDSNSMIMLTVFETARYYSVYSTIEK